MHILVTGGKGFLGQSVARHFRQMGFQVHGIGHGRIDQEMLSNYGFHYWIESGITLDSLKAINIKPDIIFHAGGGGSVQHSYDDPFLDFKKTVESTAHILEFMKTSSPESKLIYPSSPAAQGNHPPNPIKINAPAMPISPYGTYKLMAEQLCSVYRNNFGLKTHIIRFFSIYGDGLKKQLLWDASIRLLQNHENAEFWGTGKDIRDWIHIDDATRLVESMALSKKDIPLINGGSGTGHSVSDVLRDLKEALCSKSKIVFKGEQKRGDPSYYVADLTEAKLLNWSSKVDIHEGILRYSRWVQKELKK